MLAAQPAFTKKVDATRAINCVVAMSLVQIPKYNFRGRFVMLRAAGVDIRSWILKNSGDHSNGKSTSHVRPWSKFSTDSVDDFFSEVGACLLRDARVVVSARHLLHCP